MKKRTFIFYCSTICLIIGCCVIGLGIGNLFNKFREGTLIGFGIGLVFSAVILYRTYKKLLAFDKEKI